MWFSILCNRLEIKTPKIADLRIASNDGLLAENT